MCTFVVKKKDMRINFSKLACVVFVTLFLCGCRTIRYVPVETVVRDTTTYAYWDSIVNERVKIIKDSLSSFHWEQSQKSVKDSSFVKENVRERIDKDGKVIGRDSIRIEFRYVENKEDAKLRDSISRLMEQTELVSAYKYKVDSLKKVLDTQKVDVKYVQKELDGLDLLYYRIGKLMACLFIALLVVLIMNFLVKKKTS